MYGSRLEDLEYIALFQLAKEYKKLNKNGVPAEIAIVGGEETAVQGTASNPAFVPAIIVGLVVFLT